MKSKGFEYTLLVLAGATGLGMIFIGARFLIAPETAEHGYGLNFSENGDYSFHYIKGIRDLFSGALVFVFALWRQRTALALILGLGAMIPLADFLIVMNAANSNLQALWIHGITALALIILSGFLFRLKT